MQETKNHHDAADTHFVHCWQGLAVQVVPVESCAERTVPFCLPADKQAYVESLYIKRLASLADSGVLPGGDEWDVVNPLVSKHTQTLSCV